MKPILPGILAAAFCVSCSSGGSTNTTNATGGSSTGASNTGGSTTSGGGSTLGGSSATGGIPATGGSSTTGGKSSAEGGVATTGGNSGAGGRATSGGRSGTGGHSNTGGASTTTGGGSATGGGLSTGGATTIGGRSGTGGGAGVGGTAGAAGAASSTRSPGCDTPISTIPNRKTQQTMTIDGKTRFYLLNVPSNADNKTPLPLVFALHGYNMNNLSLVDLYDFTAQSGNKAITVLPQGEGDDPGTTSKWGSGISATFSANAANYTFLQTLMGDIESRFCVDKSRVFITGFSMGGMFTNSIACAHSDWFRAFAPVEGGGPGSCANTDAKPAIMVHQGTADTTVGPAMGEASRDFWLKQNGCNQTTTSTLTGCTSYGACAQPVLYCLGNWGHTVDRIARANIWSFFSSF